MSSTSLYELALNFHFKLCAIKTVDARLKGLEGDLASTKANVNEMAANMRVMLTHLGLKPSEKDVEVEEKKAYDDEVKAVRLTVADALGSSRMA